MTIENLILIEKLCTHYEVELSFFKDLDNIGLIKILIVEENHFIHKDQLTDLEKIFRLHQELNLNLEGIDVVFNLLQKVEDLQKELNSVNNRLSLYEDNTTLL
jgi:hypothetical protein